MIPLDAKKVLSPSAHSFIEKHIPRLFDIINIHVGSGSFFCKETSKLNIGLPANTRTKNWLFHELAHVIEEPLENLYLEDYGSKISFHYSYENLLKESKVFRSQIILDQTFSKVPTNLVSSTKHVRYQNRTSLLPKNKKQLRYLRKTTKKAFLSPIKAFEVDLVINRINERLDYLASLSSAEPNHFAGILIYGKIYSEEEYINLREEYRAKKAA